MEGTLEEPPIKDSSQASPDKILKDVIPNGINGNYNDKEEFIDADTNISKLVSKEISSVVKEKREANGNEDDEDKHRMEVEIEERDLEPENSEQNGIAQSRSKRSEMSESENDSKMSKSSEGVSEINNFSEVSKTEDKCKNTSCESMEVDE